MRKRITVSRRGRIAALLLLLLLISPYLNLIPISLAATSVEAASQQQAGSPLAPGTVSYLNTWNNTLTQSCPPALSTSNVLTPRSNGWNATLQIPDLLFMGSPTGGNITQHYSLFRNGTFSVSDDAGNAFSLTVPTSQFSGAAATKLVANSSMALENIRTTISASTVANVTLAFSVYKQFCQPAGIRLDISGSVNWGPIRKGQVKMSFNKAPISVSGDRAWFSNKSGVALGFDWSDSKAFSPAFGNRSLTLSYTVGSTFSIDPVTLGAAASSALAFGYQGRICNAAGLYWVFYYDGTNMGYMTSSNLGETWSSEITIPTAGYKPTGVSFYCSGNTVYYASGQFSTDLHFYYRYGTLQSNGAISWAISETSVGTYSSKVTFLSIATDSSGKIWVADREYSSSQSLYYIELYKGSSCNPTCSWLSGWSYGGTGAVSERGSLVPLTSGKMALVFSLSNPSSLGIAFYSGTSWGTAVYTSASGYNFANSGFALIGNTVEVATTDNSKEYYLSVAYSTTPSWSSPVQLEASASAYVGISSDGTSTLLFYSGHSSTVDYYKSIDAGATWSAATTISTAESGVAYLSAVGTIGNFAAVAWVSGTASPYDVRFASWPLVVPTAATSSSSWSKPGLSPYESYFTNLDEYVSPGNGLLGVEQTDLDLPGRGMDLTLTRVYSTPYAFHGSSVYQYDTFTLANLGQGWSLNFPWLGTNYLHLFDGQAYPYQWSGNSFVYHGATDFNLTKKGDGSYTLTLTDGQLYQFNSAKQLTSITDRTGSNTISFSYGANGISQITDTIGRTVSFAYTSGLLTSITSGGRTWSYAYTSGKLTSATDPLGRVTQFGYDSANGWLMTSITYPTGGKTTFTYGSVPVGTEVTTSYVTLENSYSSSTTLTKSQAISYYILNGNVVWSNSTLSDGTSTQGYTDYNFPSGANYMRVYEKTSSGSVFRINEDDYDASGRINETKIISPANALLAYSISTYDSWGNLKYSRDNVGQQTWYSYANTDSQNSFGTSGCTTSFYTQTVPTTIHDALVGSCAYQDGTSSPQMQTYYKYDSHGNLLETKVLHNSGWLYTDHTYDSYGNVLSSTDPLGRVTFYRYSSTYDDAYLTKQSIMVGTQNVTTTYTYDSTKGFLLSETDPDGYTTSYQYDSLGRVILITYPAIGGVSSTKQYSYDDTNNILTVTDENGNVAKQYYDGLGRETKVEWWNGSRVYSSETFTHNWLNEVATNTTAAGHTYTYTYDLFGRETKLTTSDGTYQTTSYDDVNNLQTVTDENGHQTVYAYDWNDRLTSVKEYNASTTYFLTTYSYDPSGNLLSVTDAKGQATSYQYDDLNRLTTTTYPDSTQETTTYDSVGNLHSVTDPNGNTVYYAYDALNRLTTVTYPNSTTVAYTYDLDGNVKSAINPSAADYYSYDARDRLTNQTEVVGGTAYQTLYTYDGVGNVLSVKYPDGYLLNMTYDALNRLKQVGSFATLSYTVDDMVSKITYGDGEVQTYAYDSRDRPTRILDKYGSTVELDLNYTYDGTGNVLTENTESYSYDWLNRLTSTTGPWGTITYTYDQVGNRVKMVQDGTPVNYVYGSYNRLSSAGSTTYTYDADGNMVARNDGTSWTFSYDYENRLTKVVHSGSTVQQNFYDAGGNRVKQITTDTVVYSYQGLDILYEKDLTTGTVTKHFYANGQQVAKMVGSGTSYVHGDHLGSTRLVMTSSLTVAFSSNYVPYGPNYGSSGSEVFMYTDKPYDSATGLYYFGARFYDPTIGRFVTEDSYGGSQEDPQSLNRYAYVRDNPLRKVDLNGHSWLDSITGVFSATLGGLYSIASDAGSVISSWESDVASIVTDIVQFHLKVTKHSISIMSSGRTLFDLSLGRPYALKSGGYRMSASLYFRSDSGRSYITHLTTTGSGCSGSPFGCTYSTKSSNVGFNWNAAASLLILVGSVMATTASAISLNPVLVNTLVGADQEVFQYLAGNPDPNPSDAAQAWVKGFATGYVCDHFHASC